MQTPRSRAIVIGGGIAGLLAARVLADHFDEVSILERDRVPQAPKARAGVPQGSHNHVLLVRGLTIMEGLFPRVRDELAALGAPTLDMAADLAWLSSAGWGVRFDSDLSFLSCSRDLLEWTIRQRLVAHERVRFVEAADVCGLLREGDRVAGVRVRRRAVSGSERDERAALVLDASGRHSRMPDWLAAMGWQRPPEHVVNGYLGYASRVYRVRDAGRLGWRGLYVQPAPPAHTRGGVIVSIEKDRWHLTLAGVGGDYPPVDEYSFLEFARSLRTPLLFETIRDAEPLSPITGFRATENRWRAYERLAQQPEGLVVLGDAACAFNPVYAQGMTTAAIAAETLATILARYSDRQGLVRNGFARAFQRALARGNAAPWKMATSEDLRLPQTTGGSRNLATRLAHAYFDRIIKLTTERPDVRLAFLRCMHMLDGASALFTPRILRAALTSRPTGTQPAEDVRRPHGSGVHALRAR